MAQCETGVIPDFTVDTQNCFEDGRVVAVAFIKTSVVFTDPTDPLEWDGLELAGDVLFHKKVRGSYPAASSTTAPGLGNQETRVNGATHQMTFFENAVKDNSPYWNALRKSNAWKLAFVVGAKYDKLFFVEETVSIDGRPAVEESLNSDLLTQVVVSWSGIDSPDVTDVPAGVFTP